LFPSDGKEQITVVTVSNTIFKEYGKQKGYTFILGANDGGSVLYGADNKDITKEVTEYLNNQYKSGKK